MWENALMVIVTVIAIFALSNLSKKEYIKDVFKIINTSNSTKLEDVIGEKGIVVESISPNRLGVVKVKGRSWTAKSNIEIPKNTAISVTSVEGVKLVVEPIEYK